MENSPDLDEEEYEPETTLRPKIPEKRLYSTHHLTMGIGLFRNTDIERSNDTVDPDTGATMMYQGFAFRYAYNFRANYWAKKRIPTLIGAELGWGSYKISSKLGGGSQIMVMPISGTLKYNFSLNSFLRVYPYMGFETNVVHAMSRSTAPIKDLKTNRLIAGGGVGMIFSENIDGRADLGIDGALIGMIVKF